MIITITGFDGVGKTTTVELLGKRLSELYGGRFISIFDVVKSEVYEENGELEVIYDVLKDYDIIATRFYMRKKSLQKLQEQIMFTDSSIFNNSELVKKVAEIAKSEATIWYDKVIKKLINQNKTIIYDRYWYDEVAYRSLYHIPQKFIEELYMGYQEPDIKIFLYGGIPLIKTRNERRDDMRTALFSSEEKIYELFQNLNVIASKYEMSKINVENKTREYIVNKILEIIQINKIQKLGDKKQL